MSAEIDRHILAKYDIKRRIGKGVSSPPSSRPHLKYLYMIFAPTSYRLMA